MFGQTTGMEKTAKCTAAIAAAFTIAKFGADDDHVALAVAATDGLIGIFQHTTADAEDQVRLALSGISPVVYGAAVTRGQDLTSDAAGKAVPAAKGDSIIGQAMISGAANDIGFVDINRGQVNPSAGVDGLHNKWVFRATFDASAGKAIGAHGLGVTLPDNAIVTRSWYEVLVTFTDGDDDSATIALGVPTDGAAAIKAAVAISNGANPWDAGIVEGLQTGAANAYMTKLTAARELTATVATKALTAGKLILFGEYVIGG
jgi:hypothetical protein